MVLGEAGGSDAASGCTVQAGLQRGLLQSQSPEGWDDWSALRMVLSIYVLISTMPESA